jgi:hypothetical protein
LAKYFLTFFALTNLDERKQEVSLCSSNSAFQLNVATLALALLLVTLSGPAELFGARSIRGRGLFTRNRS